MRCEALYSGRQVSEGHQASEGDICFIKIPIVKSYQNKEFSILTLMMFDVDSNYIYLRFQFRAISDRILEMLKNKFLMSSFMKSRGDRYDR